jgi:hypothetical protein
LAGWSKELGLVEKFEKTERRITKFDLDEAHRGD